MVLLLGKRQNPQKVLSNFLSFFETLDTFGCFQKSTEPFRGVLHTSFFSEYLIFIKKDQMNQTQIVSALHLFQEIRVENVFLVVFIVFYLCFCLLYSPEICFRIFVFLLIIFCKINITVIFFIILQVLRKVESEVNYQQTTHQYQIFFCF